MLRCPYFKSLLPAIEAVEDTGFFVVGTGDSQVSTKIRGQVNYLPWCRRIKFLFPWM
jgi:hypothetical protein